MEQHPIPQNITGFEFKLIGDMTIKQFAYLAGGIVFGYLTFITPLHPILKFPLILFVVLLGIGLAFVPVEGRPLDRWIANFIRALFAPSQYIFHKEGGAPEFLTMKAPPQIPPQTLPKRTIPNARDDRTALLLQMVSAQPTPQDLGEEEQRARIKKLTEEFALPEQTPLTPVLSGFPISSQPPSGPSPMPPMSPQGFAQPLASAFPSHDEELQKKLSEERTLEEEKKRMLEENKMLREDLEKARRAALTAQIPTAGEPASDSRQRTEEILAIERKLQEALSEKERLASELTRLKSSVSARASRETVTPTLASAPKPSEKVKSIPPQLSRATGVAGFPQFPNLVSGIVKDSKGDILPNIIVEVKDASGAPVRAFKTNKLGQFSASTSLANGRYTIELEDPRNTYSFDVIAIELKGNFFQPLEIIAKDQTLNERQHLYQALFGGKGTS